MKKNIILLSVVTLMSLSSCGGVDLEKNAPDYSSSKGEFITYGYASPTNGNYSVDGVTINTGENYQTVERYKEYKEAGLNTMMLQWEDRFPLSGETEFATSHCKHLMDLTYEAGIERCIITDDRFRSLSGKETPIIGNEFGSQAELNAYVAEAIKDYIDHPAFYGLLLIDEPRYYQLDSFGAVYKAIKAYDPNIYIESNLLPFTVGETARERFSPDWQTMTDEEAYVDYLERYMKVTGAEKILMDDYPFRVRGNSEIIKDAFFKGIQILANYCNEHNLRFETVSQSMGGKNNGNRTWSMPTLPCLEWQLNNYMSMGSQVFAFFTYWRKVSNRTDGEWFNDGESFVTSDGHLTSVYYNAQTVLREMQAFAPVILNFQYQASKSIAEEPVAFPIDYATMDDMDFALFTNDDITLQEGRMLTLYELKDETNDRYMYSVMNAMDPRLYSVEKDLTAEFSINFGNKYNAVEVYYRGVKKLVALNNGVYSSKLDAGYAEYLIPYNA